MDPNAALENIRELIARVSADEYPYVDADELSGAVEALIEWLDKGGAIPADWERN